MAIKKYESIDQYHADFPPNIREKLGLLRKTVASIAPAATEAITYSMPGFKLHGVLLCYAAWTKHIGLYAMPSAIKYFENELSGYETSKGTIKFPHDKPLPVSLIESIVRFRVQEQQRKAEIRAMRK